jgi:hypothetical protein
MNGLPRTVRVEYRIRGHASGWVRGPFMTSKRASIAAHLMAREGHETVYVELVTTTRTTEHHETVRYDPNAA